MRYDLKMIKNGLEPMSYELDIIDTLGDIWTILDNLKSRCVDDLDCPKEYLEKFNNMQNEIHKIRCEEPLISNAIEKNPSYFKD